MRHAGDATLAVTSGASSAPTGLGPRNAQSTANSRFDFRKRFRRNASLWLSTWDSRSVALQTLPLRLRLPWAGSGVRSVLMASR